MIAVVAEIRIEIDRPELGHRLVILGRLEDLVEDRRVARNVQWNGVDVPTVDQTHAGLSLVLRLEDPVPRELPLHATRPAHDIRHAHVGIPPACRSCGVIRADKRRRAIRLARELESRWSFGEAEGIARIAGWRRNRGRRQVLLVQAVRGEREDILVHHAE